MADPVPSGKKWTSKMESALQKIMEQQLQTQNSGRQPPTFTDIVHELGSSLQLEFGSERDIETMQVRSQHRPPDLARFRRVNSEVDDIIPYMNVCIMIVGTRGDVQPFIAIALRLKKDGHRVRLATHAVYREFVTGYGVEFYPLGGDPKELAAYMVKTGGHLIPLKLETLQKDVPRNMKMIEEILNSTWPAVSAADPDAGGKGVPGKSFQAHAIISNPVTYGHVHVAERLGVPLHIMFPQPWVPTQSFPHPLANMIYDNKPSKMNYMSYKMVDLLMWQGTEAMINKFRRNVIGLRKIRKGDGGRNILLDLSIPHAFMWSSALVPKPPDWGPIYDVVGTVALKEEASKYEPTPELEAFLGNDGGPIFVGFGSMVIDDPKKVTKMIIEASQKANNVRVLIQSSWSDMSGGLEVPSNIMFLGNCPHDWLMPRVCAVIHHGGAGTTAAGLLAGKPTFIVPFFGDQPFWGRAVVTAGVGVEPCPIKSLTADKLYQAFVALQAPEIRGNTMAVREVLSKEDGAEEAVHCFYRNLPLPAMRCDVDGQNIATRWSQKDRLKLCSECAFVIGSRPENSKYDIVDYQFVDYSARGPDSILEGASSGLGAFVHELGAGLSDFFVKPAKGFKDGGAKGAVVGLLKGAGSLVVSPIQGAVLFADHVATGRYNRFRGKGHRKKGTVLLGNKELLSKLGIHLAPNAHTAAMNPDETFKVVKPAIERPQALILITDEEKKEIEASLYRVMTRRNSSWKFKKVFKIMTSTGDHSTLESTPTSNSDQLPDQSPRIRGTIESEEIRQKQLLVRLQNTLIPKMNICLMTIGSWDENVQQFVAIGLRLKTDGHRVRIATSNEFRDRVVGSGLEFYPLDGHPYSMDKFLLFLSRKNHCNKQGKGFFGNFISSRRQEYSEMDEIKSLVFSLWPACVSADPLCPGLSFRADAIIAHPLLFGQTIVAERLGIPLHCISSTPLTRTQAFPHPLNWVPEPPRTTPANLSSYITTERLWGKGTHITLSAFRASLGLSGHIGDINLLTKWHVPHTYLWNSELLPKPSDWGHEISVSGFIDLGNSLASENDEVCLSSLQSFIENSGATTSFIYFGFSAGDWDSLAIASLLKSLQAAAEVVNVCLIFQTRKEVPDFEPFSTSMIHHIPSTVPVTKILPFAHAAFHWGDLLITSRCLAAGKPACVIPHDGLQRFWSQSIVKAGAGVAALELDQLTTENLVQTFQSLLSGSLLARAKELSSSFSHKNAVDDAVSAFYAQLPIAGMTCDLDSRRLARIYDPVYRLKLSYEAYYVVKQCERSSIVVAYGAGSLRYKPLKYSQRCRPQLSLQKVRLNLKPVPKFSYKCVESKASSCSPGFRDNVKGRPNVSARRHSLAVDVLQLPGFWPSQTQRVGQTLTINAAYEAILHSQKPPGSSRNKSGVVSIAIKVTPLAGSAVGAQ